MKFLRNVAAIGAAVALGAAALTASAEDRSKWPKSFTVGTASQGGTYFAYGSGWAKMVGDAIGVPGAGEVTGGPVQNLALVHTGDLAFGMTTMGPAAQALAGESPLAPGVPLDKVRAIFPMYQTPFSITVLASSPIKTIADIPAGAKIGFGPSGSTSDTYFPLMLSALGVKYERRNGGWTDLGGQLQDGVLDVIAFAAGIPVPAVSQLEAQAGIRVIEFTADEQKTIMSKFPVSAFAIKEGTYSTVKGDRRSVSMWNFAIAHADLPEDFVYAVVKKVMESNPEMVKIHKAARTTLAKHYDKNTVLKWHPGAVRWFEENGYKIPAELKD
ncbi:MAG: TAXI family TRAP transporter solute-binding subunit [Neomegalonema sp.]|nr:TAXI family TRAP transporter solute-binding subunit [Neomegalonema sp.]